MITGLKLINEAEDRMGWRQTSTLEDAVLRPEGRKLLRLLNRVLKSLQAVDDWPMLRAEGTILTVPAIEGTDYFVLVNGDATVLVGTEELATPSTLRFDDSYIGRAIQIGSEATVYRIQSLNSTTSVELNRPWIGTSSAGGAVGESLAYTIAQDQYFLPKDYCRPNGRWDQFLEPYGITPIGPDAFGTKRRGRGNSIMLQAPEVFTVFGMDAGQVYQVLHLDPFPLEQQILQFTYQKIHPEIETDADRILFPASHEGAVLEALLYLANRDYQDDSKLEAVLRDYVRETNMARTMSPMTEDQFQLRPSGNHRVAQHRRWGSGGIRTDYGAYFDRIDAYGLDR
jgi:hypothetical protein